MYPQNLSQIKGTLQRHSNNAYAETTLLKGGRVVDPKNGIDKIADLFICGMEVVGVFEGNCPFDPDRVIDCEGLIVAPGLIDMHIHLGDLFEVSTDPIRGAVADGVTMGLSPGAGNTILASSLLGAEVDRGIPMNVGAYVGAPNLLANLLSDDEIIAYYKGELPFETASTKLSRNSIACDTGMLHIGVKDHMAHFLMDDSAIERVFNISSKAGLIYMSHTQDPAHAERMAKLAKGRPLHLAHATAAGCGTHDDPVNGMKRIVDLLGDGVTAEFVTSMVRPFSGCREGLILPSAAREIALQALADKKVKILISDGQNDATMKGFGDSRDNVPAIIELWQNGVLSLSDSVATMTANPAALIAERTGNSFFLEKTGHLGAGALANITVIHPEAKRAVFTFVNGTLAGFEQRAVRSAAGAGGLVSRFGLSLRTGVGDLAIYK